MSDNVLILGAGFSHAAGIPLLSGFVDTMWSYALRGVCPSGPISPRDLDLLKSALRIRADLDAFHGRASFDDRNIEDLLSLLTFDALASGSRQRHKLAAMARAIATTIELSCSVTHPGPHPSGANGVVETGPDLYRAFWRAYLRHPRRPAIVTTNHDLVLERSLFQVLIGTNHGDFRWSLPFDTLGLEYDFPPMRSPIYRLVRRTFHAPDRREVLKRIDGTVLEAVSTVASRHLDIALLKLHGSVNFPAQRDTHGPQPANPAISLDTPLIVPPVSNKVVTSALSNTWRSALGCLRTAKNIVIVGYSLPKTDTYMQYFLKAAIGPNRDLSRIHVFDPLLFTNTPQSASMRQRYVECFSPQLHDRISFEPAVPGAPGRSPSPGTAEHFVAMLVHDPDAILF